MESSSFGSKLDIFESQADAAFEEMAYASKKDDLKTDQMVALFASTVADNADSCMLSDQKFVHVMAKMRCLSDEKGSSETQRKLEKAFELVLASQQVRLTEDMSIFINKVDSAGRAKACSALSETFFDARMGRGLEAWHEFFQEPDNVLLLFEFGTESFINGMMLLCDIDVSREYEGANTLLHFAAERKDLSETIRRLIDRGLSVDSLNDKGETPLGCAVRTDSLPAAKKFVEGGASIHVGRHLWTADISSSMAAYLKKQLLKIAGSNLSGVNQKILHPPGRPGGAGVMMRTIVPTGMGQASKVAMMTAGQEMADRVNLIKASLVLVRGYVSAQEGRRSRAENPALQREIESLEGRIDDLQAEIESSSGSKQQRLMEDKTKLQHELKELVLIDKSQHRRIQAEVVKRGLVFQQEMVRNLDLLVGEIPIARIATTKGALFGLGAVGSALSVFQHWNDLEDIDLKNRHLSEVRRTLMSAHTELGALSLRTDLSSMELRVIRMKMGSIKAKIDFVDDEARKLSQQGSFRRMALTGTTVATGLLVYGTFLYMSASADDDLDDVPGYVQHAGHVGTVSGFLPAIGPPLVSGVRWLWNKGVTAVYGKELSTEQQIIERDAKAEAELLSRKKKLEKRLSGIDYTLRYGYEVGFASVEIPEVGTKEYNDLIEERTDIELELEKVAEGLKEHASAKRFGMTRMEYVEELESILSSLSDTGNRKTLKAIIKSHGVDVSEFDENPLTCLLEYLMQ